MLKKAAVFLCILLVSSVAFAQELTATTLVDLNMRAAPDQSGAVITKLPVGTSVVIEGRDSNQTWLLVHSGASRGWMAIQFLRFDQEIAVRNLPDLTGVDVSQPFATAEPGQPNAPTPIVIPPERTDYPPLTLTDAALNRARSIYARGQQMGNNPNSLIKIGESNTAGTVYMCPFNYGNYDLAGYTDLQGVVDRFNATGSWCRYSYTARSGFATANLLDPQWAIEGDCQSGETPLDCADRIYNPSYAMIYLGIADMGFYSEQAFRTNLTNLLNWLADHGIVPVLTTYPMADTFNDGKPQIFNAIIREVAASENIPLIDLRSALYTYNNRGTGPDGYHLSVRDPESSSFGGDQNTYGRTLRELLTLQMLQRLSF